ncbi:MAG: MATE family efflux transporter [Gammaproteobacteria bacterium]
MVKFSTKSIESDPIDLKTEIRYFLMIAFPLSAAYLAEYAMFITTKMVVGKLGYQQLAAVGIAGDLSFEILVILMGLLSIIGVLAAQAEGAGKKSEVGQSVRQGLIVASMIGIPAMVFIWNLDLVLIATTQDPVVIEFAIPYLRGISGMVLPVLWFAVFRNYTAALAQPLAVMVISVGAVFLNYLLTIWLVHGGLGLAAMGLFGAGLATTIVTWLMFLSLTLYVYLKPKLRGYGVFQGAWRLHWPTCAEIFRLGIPVAGLVFLEAGLFVAVSILSGVISVKTLAAYEVVMSWVGIPFVIALGFAEATMVRVAHAVGRNHFKAVRRAGHLGMTLGVGLLTILVVIPLGFPDQIIRIFISPADPGFVEVSKLAAQFLMIGAIFQVFDGLQAIAARALRGLKDSVAPLWIAGFGYWVLGIGGGSMLAFPYGYGGAGLWWGMASGLMVTASLLCWRFNRFSARPLELVVVDG